MSYLLKYFNSESDLKMQFIKALQVLKKRRKYSGIRLDIYNSKKSKITRDNPNGYYLKPFVKIGNTDNAIIQDLIWNQKSYGRIYSPGKLKKDEIRILSFILYNHEILKDYSTSLHEQKINNSKNIFMANVSHEIRTPLNSILGNLDCLQELKLSESSQETLDVIQNSCYNLLYLVNDILDISGLEAGKMNLHLSPENIQEIVDSSYSVSKTHKKEYVEFSREIAVNVPKIMVVDQQRIKQILVNLLSNAFKYTSQGSVKLSVSRATKKDLSVLDLPAIETVNLTPKKFTRYFYRNNSVDYNKKGERIYVKFQIQDTGIGIKVQDIDKLFERFSNVQSPRSKNMDYTPRKTRDESTGLGLAISQGLCKLMQGNIGFNSNQGQGSCFYFIIPIDTYNETENILIKPKNLKNKNILIVDDKVENIIVLSKMLDNHEINYTGCISGQHAIMSYLNNSRYNFDLVLIDILMPVMDGNELAEYIYKSNIKTPLIALSSTNNIDNINKHFQDVLQKPYTEEDLIRAIYRVLSNTTTKQNKIVQYNSEICETPLSSSSAEIMENNLQINILIVEDNYYNEFTLKKLLNCLGYFNITYADSGETAIEIVRGNQNKKIKTNKKTNKFLQVGIFDVVLMDIVLPGINGIEASDKIIEMFENKKHAPEIIAISASLNAQTLVNTSKNISSLISKPVRKNELYNVITRIKQIH